MRNIILFGSAFLVLLLSGCTCQNEQLRHFKAIRMDDHKLPCKQLRESILAAKHYHNLAEHQLHNPIAYSRYPVVCSFPTYTEGKRVSLATQDRIEYLESLLRNKNCGEKVAVQPKAAKTLSAPVDADEEKQMQFMEIPTNDEQKTPTLTK